MNFTGYWVIIANKSLCCAQFPNCSYPHFFTGRNYMLYCFFGQLFLTNRYVHRTELWIVSSEKLFIVQFIIKKLFWIRVFHFFTKLRRFKILWIFEFYTLLLSTVSEFLQMFTLKVIDSYLQCHRRIVESFYWFFGLIFFGLRF